MTALSYPSGRTVNFSYNSGEQLDRAQFTQWRGSSVTPYSYWSATDNNFYASGGPKSWSSDEEALSKRGHCWPPQLLQQAWDYLARRVLS